MILKFTCIFIFVPKLCLLEENLHPLPYVKNLNTQPNETIITQQDSQHRSQFPNITFDVPPIIPPVRTGSVRFPSCGSPGQCTATSGSPLLCYDTKMPYSKTGISLVSSGSSIEQWVGLQQFPTCWEAVQPIICSSHLPKCEDGFVQKIPRHLCKRAQKPCQIISQLLGSLPEFLNCTNDQIFSDCRGAELSSDRVRFNVTSTSCVSPLVYTKTSPAYLPDLDHCGMKCRLPLLSHEEYSRVHRLVGVGGVVSLVCSLFAVLTFLVDWKGGSKYPALAIFYMNLCFLAVSIGWLAQFSPGGRQDIVCRKDGTARLAEPGENLSCTVVFVLIYYFSISASVWLCILAYSWSISFTMAQHGNKAKDMIDSRAAYFHMVAWSLPLVLTITIMAMNKVDSSAMTGICFVGYNDPTVRSLFVLTPHCLALLVSGCFSCRSVMVLGRVWLGANTGIVSQSASGKVQTTLVKISMFSCLTTGCVLATVSFHVYRYSMEEGWKYSLEQFVKCKLLHHLNGDDDSTCQVDEKPSILMIQLELLILFLAGVLASSWVWTKETINIWSITVRQIFNKKDNQRPLRLRKHEVIAQAFSKRNELQINGRLSLSFQSAHDDPLGLDLQVGDTSGEFSSEWAAALPHLVTRRGGLCGADQLGLVRRNSIDSVSNVSRSISIRSGKFSWFGSRKGSVDSHQSIQQSDIDRLQSIYDKTVKTKKRSKRDFFKSHRSKIRPWSKMSSRRNSVTSGTSTGDNSSVFSQVLPAITLDPKKLTKKVGTKFTLPTPGHSTDFGRMTSGPTKVTDSTYKELEEKLKCLAIRTSTDRDLDIPDKPLTTSDRPQTISMSVQTSQTDFSVVRRQTADAGTQMSPVLTRRKDTATDPSGDTLPPLLSPSTSSNSPLNHIEANVVNIRLLGPSSEDSSIPSSFEKDFKMKKMSPRGKENIDDMISIPALRPMNKRDGGGLLKPRDHQRGRRGAIVQKLSPKADTDTATDS